MSDSERLNNIINSSRSLEEKKAACEQLCAEGPDDAVAWCYLGYVEGKLGMLDESERHLRNALNIQPRYIDALNCLGNTLMDAEKYDSALAAFRQANSVGSENPGILNNIGQSLKAMGMYESAIGSYQRALELSPSYVAALINLGHTLHLMARYNEAIACFERALVYAPGDTGILTQFGMALKNSGRLDEALAVYRRALEIQPDLNDAVCGSAAVLYAQEKYDECHALIKSMTDEQRCNPVVAILYNGLCHRYGLCDDALKLSESILKQPGLDNWSNVQLHFSMGKLYDRMNKYDDAFRHYEKGNNLKKCSFSADSMDRYVKYTEQAFTGEKISILPRVSIRSEKPVFIVGMPRSGTTLVEQILASHPDVFGAGELPYIEQAYSVFTSRYMPDNKNIHVASLTSAALDELAGNYLEKLDRLSPDSARCTDKMPFNFLRLGLIQLLFPDARVIHCSRNAMDTCISCYFQDFQHGNDYAYSLSDLGMYYRQYVRLFRHWKRTLSLPIFELSYEDLVGNTEEMTRRLVEFCGLDWNEKCLSFHETSRYIATASKDQVNKPVYTSSIGRWRNYVKHIGQLRSSLGEYAEDSVNWQEI